MRTLFTLATFSVEKRPKGWFYSRYGGKKGEYRGPYKSEASVTLVIAREMKRELVRRMGSPS